jgi:cytochrome c-type biogenesis protein CcmH
MRGAFAIACVVMSVAAAAQLARAQGPQPSGKIISASGDSRLDDSVRSVSSQLRCPVCQGESIQESPAELAKEMRQVVREQLAAGRSSDEVKAYFVSKYGEWILLEPKAHGANLTVYLLPFVMLLGGAILIVIAVRRWTRASPAPHSESP